MKPGERQLWRVLNASAITYLESRGALRAYAAAARHRRHRRGADHGSTAARPRPIAWVDHIGMPPGARVEFIVKGPPVGSAGAAGDADGRYRAGRRKRSESRARVHRRRGRCAGTAAQACPPILSRCRRRAALARRRRAGARAESCYFSETISHGPEQSQERQRISTSPWMARRRRLSIRNRTFPTSSSSKGMWRTGSSRTARWSCTISTSTKIHFLLRRMVRPSGQRAVSARYGQRPVLQRPHARISERAAADGFPRSEHRRHLHLSLPSSRA